MSVYGTCVLVELWQCSTSGPRANMLSFHGGGVGKQTNWVTLSESVADLEKGQLFWWRGKRGQSSYGTGCTGSGGSGVLGCSLAVKQPESPDSIRSGIVGRFWTRLSVLR